MKIAPILEFNQRLTGNPFDYFLSIWNELKPITSDTYFNSLKHWTHHRGFSNHSIKNIYLSAITFPNQESADFSIRELYRNKMNEYSPATLHLLFSAISWIFRTVKRIGVIDYFPHIPHIEIVPYRDTTGPPPQVIRNIISMARKRNDVIGTRDVAILSLLFSTGLRRSELANIRISDLYPSSGYVLIIGKRRREPVKIYISDHIIELLINWLRIRPSGNLPGKPSGYLFTRLDPAVKNKPPSRLSVHGIYKMVRKYSDAVGWRISPHQIRHSAITAALNYSNDIRLSARFSRHRNISTIQIYDDNRHDSAHEISDYLSTLIQ